MGACSHSVSRRRLGGVVRQAFRPVSRVQVADLVARLDDLG